MRNFGSYHDFLTADYFSAEFRSAPAVPALVGHTELAEVPTVAARRHDKYIAGSPGGVQMKRFPAELAPVCERGCTGVDCASNRSPELLIPFLFQI